MAAFFNSRVSKCLLMTVLAVVAAVYSACSAANDTERLQKQIDAGRAHFLDSLSRETDSIVAAQAAANQGWRLAHHDSAWGEGIPVRRADLGSAWPLKVGAGRIKCRGNPANVMLVFSTGGNDYALNGTAAARYPEIDPIWRSDPRGYAPKMMITPLLDYARNVCL